MNIHQLALHYVIRKRSRSILLFFVFVLVSSMILSTSMLLRAAEGSLEAMGEKSQSKIIAEIKKEDARITEKEAVKAADLREVSFINRLARGTAFPAGFQPVISSSALNEGNAQVMLLSYDDLEKDSPFFEKRYHLVSGKLFEKGKGRGLVINRALAEANGRKLGDFLEFETKSGKKAKAKIIGLFASGNEEKQPDDTLSSLRIENQIFMDNETFSSLFEKQGCYKLAVYTSRPNQLAQTQKQLAKVLGPKVEMTTSDSLYRQMEAPLKQIAKATRLMLILTLLSGTLIVSLLLCMWVRTRQKEMGIFISMGRSRISVFLQAFWESASLFLLSILAACGLGTAMAQILQAWLTPASAEDVTFSVALNPEDAGQLIGLGGMVVLIAVSCSLIPVFRAKPKDILSRMEG